MKNYINQYKQTYKRIKDIHYKAKLRDLKSWAQVNGPRPIQGILSYALDWLSPELLGTGFRMREISDDQIQGRIPKRAGNLDLQSEINSGLAVNAALELARVAIQQQTPDESFRVLAHEVKLQKRFKWDKDLVLTLKLNQQEFDNFFMELQESRMAEISLEVFITLDHHKKKEDKINLNLKIESVLQIKEPTHEN